MRGISRRMAVGLLGLVVVVIVGATLLGPDKPATEPSGRAGSALSATDLDGDSESGGRPVITLGDLDPSAVAVHSAAPIDTCAVVDRDVLPVEARPAEDPVRLAQPAADGGSRCLLDYRAGPSVRTALTIIITWTASPPDPAKYPGARAATFAGRVGQERAATGPHGEQICLGLMPASGGTAAVRVSNTRYPTVDPCAVTAAVLTAIAHKTQ